MPTLDEMLGTLPVLTQQQQRAARLRAEQEKFIRLASQPGVGNSTPTQRGGLYETVAQYRPDYAAYGNQIAGSIGEYLTGRAADKADLESANARNAEILKTVEAIGQTRAQPAGTSGGGPTEQALRGYLSLLGGPDVQDILGKQAHVSGIKTDSDGNMVLVMSDGTQTNTGQKMDYQTQVITDPVTGEVKVVGKSGAGRGKAADVTYGQPNTAAPPVAPGGVVAPDVGGPKPVIDVPEVNENVRAMIANGVAFMQSIGLPEEQQNAWVAEQIGKARTAQAYAATGGANPQRAAPQGGPPAVGGAPLRISGAGDIAAAKIAAENAAAAQTAQAEGLKTQERELAQKRVELRAQLPNMKARSESMSNAIAKLKASKGLDNIIGGSIMGAIPNEGHTATVARGLQSVLDPTGADAMALYDNVVGKNYAQAFETLKGGGPITEKETERVANAYAALQRSQTKQQFLANLDELDRAVKAGYQRLEEISQGMGNAPAAPPATNRPSLPPGFSWGD